MIQLASRFFVSFLRVLLRNPLSSLLLVFFADRLGARSFSFLLVVGSNERDSKEFDEIVISFVFFVFPFLFSPAKTKILLGDLKYSWKTIFSCFMIELSKRIMHNSLDAINQSSFYCRILSSTTFDFSPKSLFS